MPPRGVRSMSIDEALRKYQHLLEQREDGRRRLAEVHEKQSNHSKGGSQAAEKKVKAFMLRVERDVNNIFLKFPELHELTRAGDESNTSQQSPSDTNASPARRPVADVDADMEKPGSDGETPIPNSSVAEHNPGPDDLSQSAPVDAVDEYNPEPDVGSQSAQANTNVVNEDSTAPGDETDADLASTLEGSEDAVSPSGGPATHLVDAQLLDPTLHLDSNTPPPSQFPVPIARNRKPEPREADTSHSGGELDDNSHASDPVPNKGKKPIVTYSSKRPLENSEEPKPRQRLRPANWTADVSDATTTPLPQPDSSSEPSPPTSSDSSRVASQPGGPMDIDDDEDELWPDDWQGIVFDEPEAKAEPGDVEDLGLRMGGGDRGRSSPKPNGLRLITKEDKKDMMKVVHQINKNRMNKRPTKGKAREHSGRVVKPGPKAGKRGDKSEPGCVGGTVKSEPLDAGRELENTVANDDDDDYEDGDDDDDDDDDDEEDDGDDDDDDDDDEDDEDEEGDEGQVQVEEANANDNEKKRLSGRKRWDCLSDVQKQSKTVQCRAHISVFLQNKTPIPIRFRRMLRDVAELCPEVGCLTRELAIHCLTTKYLNIVCPYHLYHNKISAVNDTNPPVSNAVTGVPWVRRAASNKRTKGEPLRIVRRAAGKLHCGCFEDDVLLDFWWWKQATLASPSQGIVEPWRKDRLHPYERGFMVQWWTKWTGVSIKDIYSNTQNPAQRELLLIRKMRKALQQAEGALERRLISEIITISDTEE